MKVLNFGLVPTGRSMHETVEVYFKTYTEPFLVSDAILPCPNKISQQTCSTSNFYAVFQALW